MVVDGAHQDEVCQWFTILKYKAEIRILVITLLPLWVSIALNRTHPVQVKHKRIYCRKWLVIRLRIQAWTFTWTTVAQRNIITATLLAAWPLWFQK